LSVVCLLMHEIMSVIRLISMGRSDGKVSMTSTVVRTARQMRIRAILFFSGIIILFLGFPDANKPNSVGLGYWHGLEQRLTSGTYWAKAFGCGLAATLILVVLAVIVGAFDRDRPA